MRLTATALLTAVLLSASGGEPPAVGPEPITLSRAIEMALTRNLDLEVERLSPAIAEQGVDKALSVFDPTATLSYGDRDERSASTSSLAGASTVIQRTTTYAGGIKQKLQTGTTLDLSLSYIRASTNSLYSTLDPSHTSGATLSVKQSLLRGFGLKANRAELAGALHSRDAARQAFTAKVVQTVSDVEGAYWDLSAGLKGVEVARTALKAAQSLEEASRAKVDAGTLPKTDLLEASSASASREADLIDAERKAEDARDRLRQLVAPPGRDGAADWGLALVPADEPSTPDLIPDLPTAVARALCERPELAQARATLLAAESSRLSAENTILPDLSVSGAWGQQGVDGDREDAFSRLNDGRSRTWELGLSLEIPLGNRAAKSDLRKAKAQADQAAARLRVLEEQVVVEVRAAGRAVESARRRVEAGRRAVAFAREKARDEQLRLEQGLSTAHAVLDASRTQAGEEGRLTTSTVDLLKAITAWHKAQAGLLQARGIRLE